VAQEKELRKVVLMDDLKNDDLAIIRGLILASLISIPLWACAIIGFIWLIER
jgi:hypothetical protein